MKNIFIISILLFSTQMLFGQSATTQKLHKKHDDAFSLFFYKNTLQMLNQEGNEEFAQLIDNVEKMKFLRVEKMKKPEVTSLIDQYKEEAFEELMSVRNEDQDMKIFIKEKDKVTLGLIMLINDNEALSILDIKGSVPFDQLTALYNKVRTLN